MYNLINDRRWNSIRYQCDINPVVSKAIAQESKPQNLSKLSNEVLINPIQLNINISEFWNYIIIINS